MAIADRDDPRPQIVLAYHYANFGARSDSITRYQKAYAANPAARGDPRMLPDLVDFAAHDDPRIAWSARRAVIEIYGRDARPYVENEIARRRADQGARLRRLLAELPR